MSKADPKDFKTTSKRSNEEHNVGGRAKDVVAYGLNPDDGEYYAIEVDADGVISVNTTDTSVATDGVTYNDNTFQAGDSPIVLDLATDLGSRAKRFMIANTGDEAIDVEYSFDGVAYKTAIRLPARGTITQTSIRMAKIRLTHTGDDTAYFVTAS